MCDFPAHMCDFTAHVRVRLGGEGLAARLLEIQAYHLDVMSYERLC